MTEAEFDGVRAQFYEQAIAKYPHAREDDLKVMSHYLDPRQGERILGFGEGNGFFCSSIAQGVGRDGLYLVTDPSKDQLDNLARRVSLPQVQIRRIGAEDIDEDSFDKVWSFGAFHHCPSQTSAMERIYKALKDKGKLVLCDVFQGTSLAAYFDEIVARYCVTGHEVKFLSDEFARTLGYIAGFDDVEIVDLPQKWRFQTERDLGEFMYKLHALTNLPGSEEEKIEETVEGCRRMLGIEFTGSVYELNLPLKALLATK